MGLLAELYTRITEVLEGALELEDSRLLVEAPETMLRWSGVQVVAERVELRFRPIHRILRWVDPLLMG